MTALLKQISSSIKGDRWIWMAVMMLSLISVLAVYSASGTLAYRQKGGVSEFYLFKQLALILLGLLSMYLAHRPGYRSYQRFAKVLLWVSIPLLLFTLFFGTDHYDARRSITLPLIKLSFQTSDLAKFALIIYVARYLSQHQEIIRDFKRGFLPILSTIGLVCALIAPADLSTALVLFATCMLILFIGRARLSHIMLTFGAGAAAMTLVIGMAYAFPDVGRFETWTSRIESFMSADDSYQVQQAKIAVASGGLFGKGPGNSTQRNFLPEAYNDFIGAIIFEEYGMIGGVFVIFLYLVILYRAVKIVLRSPGTFGALLAIGITLALVIQAFINFSVALNLLPVTGLTLPFVSMGGTSLWFTSIGLGIVLSVSRYIELNDSKAEASKSDSAQVNAAA